MPPAAGTAASLPEAMTGAMWASLPTVGGGVLRRGRSYPRKAGERPGVRHERNLPQANPDDRP